MPGMNRTGPMGNGPMTGRGLGVCGGRNAANFGRGFGMRMGNGFGSRRGFGRSFVANPITSEEQKDILIEQREFIQNELENINKQLEEL